MSEVTSISAWVNAAGVARPKKLKDKIDILERRLGGLFLELFHTYTQKRHLLTPHICLYVDYNFKNDVAVIKLWPHVASAETCDPTGYPNIAVEYDMDRFFADLAQIADSTDEEVQDEEHLPVRDMKCSIDRPRVIEAERPCCDGGQIAELTEFSLTASPLDLLALADEFMKKQEMFDEDIPIKSEKTLDWRDSELILNDENMGQEVLKAMPFAVYINRETAVTAGYIN